MKYERKGGTVEKHGLLSSVLYHLPQLLHDSLSSESHCTHDVHVMYTWYTVWYMVWYTVWYT